MRFKGKITTWNDERGFGFVTPVGGGERVFLHISGFSSRRRRPVENDMVTYEVGKDEKKRARAAHVRFSVLRSAQPMASGTATANTIPLAFTLIFLLLVAAEAFRGKLPVTVFAFYVAASVFTYLAYAIDKAAAQSRSWRTKENTLHLLGLVGGWPGAALAQKIVHHKSRKPEFQRVFWTTVVLNCAALAWLLTPKGSEFLRSVL